MRIVTLAIVFIVIGFCAQAQQDLTLYELRSAPQAHTLNPSRKPLSQAYVLLPGLSGGYFSFNSEGFAYADAFELNEDSTIDVKLGEAIEFMKDQNNIGFDMRLPILGFGFAMGVGYGSFSIENKSSTRFTYPKTLAEFIWLGNGDEKFLGQRASFDGLGVDFMQYTEVAFGYARSFTDQWSFGIRAKYLSGQGYFRTTKSTLGLTTNADNYAITLDGQIDIRAAGIPALVIDSLLGFGALNIGDLGDQLIQAGSSNHGGAIDFGATFNIDEQWSVSASVLDLGVINWGKSAIVRTSQPISYTYEGLEVANFTGETDGASEILSALDSLTSSIKFDEKNESFTTLLPTKIYLGGNYRVLPTTEISALSYNEIYNGQFRTSFRLGVTQKVRNFLQATMNYSVYGNSAANIGLGFVINGGPIQFYTVTDNVIGFLAPEYSQNFHLRAGINLTFGNNLSQH